MIKLMRSYWKTYPLKKRSLAPRESSGNKNFSNPSGIIKNPLINMILTKIMIKPLGLEKFFFS